MDILFDWLVMFRVLCSGSEKGSVMRTWSVASKLVTASVRPTDQKATAIL
jgi:hypothetical protein